jgi:hypothetical protein
MGQSSFRPLNLPSTCQTSKMLNHFNYLRNAGGSDRVTLGQKPPAGIDWEFAIQIPFALVQQNRVFPRLAQSKTFAPNHLCNGVAVVHLGKI